MNGAPLTRTPPRRSWGRGPPPTGWRRIQARRATCLLRVFYCELCSAPTGRVPGLRGAFIIASTPSLLCWFRGPTSRYCCAVGVFRQCGLSYLLTYLPLKPERPALLPLGTAWKGSRRYIICAAHRGPTGGQAGRSVPDFCLHASALRALSEEGLGHGIPRRCWICG